MVRIRMRTMKSTTMKSMCWLLLIGIAKATTSSKDPPQPAQICPSDPTLCQLPDCSCPTTNLPPGFTPSTITDIPQIVMLSFDDALTKLLYDKYYSPLFARNYKNPDGCEIGVTFFLSHDYTDYTLVNDVYNNGHEIASHSITHQTPSEHWRDLNYTGYVDEFAGMRELASTFANIPSTDIQGTRVPFLQVGGDAMFGAIKDSGFTYDCSMPTRRHVNPPLWPYSLDYKASDRECQIEPCPMDSYPNFWEVPLVDYNSSTNIPCAMLDTCPSPKTADDTFNFLKYNFEFHYNTNRAPFGVFTHASWFLVNDPAHFDGYLQFLDYINSLDDVYIVTMSKALAWVRNPTQIDDLPDFPPWYCIKPSATCAKNTCYYATTPTPSGGERYMNTCVDCPPDFPWVGNPLGN